jgi:hypothetical protein
LPYAGLIKLFLVAGVLAMTTSLFITYAATPVTIGLLQILGYEGIVSMLGVWGVITLLGVIWSFTKVVNVNTTTYYPDSDLHKHQIVSKSMASAVAVSVLGAGVGLAVGTVVRALLELAVKHSGSDLVGQVVLVVFMTAIILAIVGVTTWGMCRWVVYWLIYQVVDLAVDLAEDSAEDSFIARLLPLVGGFGASVGTGIIAGFLNPLILLALTGTSLPTLAMLLYSPISHRQLIAKYRQSEEFLIKP